MREFDTRKRASVKKASKNDGSIAEAILREVAPIHERLPSNRYRSNRSVVMEGRREAIREIVSLTPHLLSYDSDRALDTHQYLIKRQQQTERSLSSCSPFPRHQSPHSSSSPGLLSSAPLYSASEWLHSSPSPLQ